MSSDSRGDPRVHLLMNLVLSVVFAWIVVSGLAFVSDVAFSLQRVAVFAGVLMILTHLVTR